MNRPLLKSHSEIPSKNPSENKILKRTIPYSIIIDYLNQKSATQYKQTSKKTRTLIHTRWAEGYVLEDFIKVIDLKCTEWLHDPFWSRYLRPETLFGPKFESYLDQKPAGARRISISMTKGETFMLLELINGCYDSFTLTQKKVNAWHAVLEPYQFAQGNPYADHYITPITRAIAILSTGWGLIGAGFSPTVALARMLTLSTFIMLLMSSLNTVAVVLAISTATLET